MMLGNLCFAKGKKAPTAAHVLFLAAAILIGCGGGGAGGDSSPGVTGGATGATTSTASTTGVTTGTNGSNPFALFYGSDAGGNERGYQIQSNGTGRTAINTSGNALSFIAVNREATKFAFVVWDLYKHIYIMNPNGTGLAQITSEDWDTAWPCFSPDGTKILYTSYEDGIPQLWTMNADGTGKVALTNLPDGAMQGRYSPNGEKIVYVSNSGNDDVWIMNANGTGAVALAATAEDESEPAFTHDGSKVVFVKSIDNEGDVVGQIHIVNASGGSVTRLTTDHQDDREPVVSLDGSTILFTRTFDTGREIFAMTLTGTGQVRVTNEGAWVVSPSTGN